MITLTKFLDCVAQNANRIHGYELGHDGSDGLSDCVGLIIGALRLAGIDYKGVHGSNYFARNYTSNLHEVNNSAQLQKGDIVYKAYEPGDPKYNLPSRYSSDPDKRDYYHIGVVTNTSPFCISHCSSGGMHYDSSLGKWRYAGQCTYVNYEGGDQMNTPYTAKVNITSGYLNVRSEPTTSSKVVGKLYKDDQVEVIEECGDWDFIEGNGVYGYASAQYLIPVNDDTDTDTDVIIRLSRAEAQELHDALIKVIQILEKGVD